MSYWNLLPSILFLMILSVKFGPIISVDDGGSSLTMNKVKKFENITKGAQFKRSYRGLELDNGLKVLLVSEPNLPNAQVAMSVAVGALNGFDELPGMAHLVGEMLMNSGSAAHPEETFANIIDSRLPTHIRLNEEFPKTEEDKQLFSFEIDANYLSPTLEIFSQFFREPFLMTSESRALLEVSIQHLGWLRSNIPTVSSDGRWRLQQIKKSISAKDHPFNRPVYGYAGGFTKYLVQEEGANQTEPSISSGVLELDQTTLREKVKAFHSKWYSSNVMCLVVFGKESLDDLESLVVPLFKDVQNKHVEKLSFSYEQHSWKENELGRKIYVTSNPASFYKDEIVLLVFRVPDIRHQYRTAPELYVSRLLRHGGPGSLVSVLQNRRLCSQLHSNYDVQAGIGFFTIKCDLFNEYDRHEDEIVELMFQYILLLKTDGIHRSMFEEHERLSKRLFSDLRYEDPVEFLASTMHYYPMNDLLSRKYLQDDWKPSLIEKFLTYLTPDNMNEKFQNLTPQPDEWHTIPYKVEMISKQMLKKWNTVNVLPEFQVPRANEFIPENLDIFPLNSNEPEDPYIIYKSQRSQIWFSQDNQSRGVRIKLDLFNLKEYSDPSNSILLCIFSGILNHVMSKYKYALSQAGYIWGINVDDHFIRIDLRGDSDKIHTVLQKILSKISIDRLTNTNLQEEFQKKKLECIDEKEYLKNHSQVVNHLKEMLTEASKSWSPSETIAAAKILQSSNWEKFLRKMLPQIFVQGIIFGNCFKQKAADIAKMIESPFELATKLIPQDVLGILPRVIQIEKRKHFVNYIFSNIVEKKYTPSEEDLTFSDSEEDENISNDNSPVHIQYSYYQFGVGTNRNITISSLIIQMIGAKCDDITRGDVAIQCTLSKVHGVIGLLFRTFASHLPSDHVDSQFEDCLSYIYANLQELTDVEFEDYVKSLILKKEDSHFTLMERFWEERAKGLYDLQDDIVEQVEVMNLLTKADVLTFFEDTLQRQSPNRRKYTILLFPKDSEGLSSADSLRKISNSIPVAFTVPKSQFSNLKEWRLDSREFGKLSNKNTTSRIENKTWDLKNA